MPNKITTQNESWVHHYTTDHGVLQCTGNTHIYLQLRSSRFCHQQGRLCLTMFAYFDCHWIISRSKDENVNDTSCCVLLNAKGVH